MRHGSQVFFLELRYKFERNSTLVETFRYMIAVIGTTIASINGNVEASVVPLDNKPEGTYSVGGESLGGAGPTWESPTIISCTTDLTVDQGVLSKWLRVSGNFLLVYSVEKGAAEDFFLFATAVGK
jgi:hypothetical protein